MEALVVVKYTAIAMIWMFAMIFIIKGAAQLIERVFNNKEQL